MATAVSYDGSTVVGTSSSALGHEAFIWTEADGMLGLGRLPAGIYDTGAMAVSADGSIVVGGGSTSPYEQVAFIWDRINGMRSLRQVLIDEHGLGSVLSGWSLTIARGISADGKTIVGWGRNPDGNTEAWIARLDVPPSPAGVAKISFSQLSVDTNPSLAGAQADNEIHSGDLSSKPHIEYQQLVALTGDGDPQLSPDEVGYNLSDCGYGGRVTSLKTDNDAADPVLIRASGRINNNTDGDLTGAVRFSNERGFGLDNGPDGEGMARWLNNGDALNFQVNAADGSDAPALRALSFVVNVRDDAAPGATVGVVLDVDGDLLADTNGPAKQGGFVTDGLLKLPALADGAKVRIDFVNQQITVDGVAQLVEAAFWQAIDDEGGDRLTIGAEAGDGTGFAVKDLTLETVLD